MDKLSFQPASEADIPVITDVLTDATQYKLKHADSSWGTEGWFQHEIQERMDDGNLFYLVKLNDEVVGTASLSWQDERNWGKQPDNAGYLHQLAVKDGYHGQNLGSQIIDRLGAEVLSNGRQFLRLDCNAQNAELCAYYEKLGFEQVGTNTRPDNELGTYQSALYERPVQITG